MIYNDVTMSPDDIEWLHDRPDEFYDTKRAIWDADDFNKFVTLHGLEDALNLVTHFHRVVANQLLDEKCDDPTESDWAGRAISLCSQLRYRRSQLRRAYKTVHGQADYSRLLNQQAKDWPRSVSRSQSRANQRNKERS